jgi:hypothetical protein
MALDIMATMCTGPATGRWRGFPEEASGAMRNPAVLARIHQLRKTSESQS